MHLHQVHFTHAGVLGFIHNDTRTATCSSMGYFVRGKLVYVEQSQALVQAQTPVVQLPLKTC